MRVQGAIVAWLAAAGVTASAEAQRPPPPIVTDFDGETTADRAELPRTPPPPGPRPLPPIVTEFDPPPEGEDGAYEPRIDEDEDQGVDAAATVESEEPEEDADEARRHLQHALLVERRRQMARASMASNARLLASPFRTTGDAPPTPRTVDTPTPGPLPTQAIDRLELGVVSANAPAVSTGLFDDGLHNRVGVGLDAFREREGARVRFEPVALLTGPLDSPAEFVRGAFAVTATYRTSLPSLPVALFLGGGFEHVSDFSTTGVMGVVMTNAIVARGGLLFDAGLLHGLVRGGLGVHVASDTSLLTDDGGMQSAELSLDVVLRSGSPVSAMGNVQLCGALHGSYLAPNGARIVEEARFSAMLGGCVRDATLGELSLMAEVSAGSLATWVRQRREEHVGISLRWSL